VKDYPPLLQALQLRNIWWQDGKGKIEYAAPDDTRLPQTIYLGSPTANGIHSNNSDPARQALIVFSPGDFSRSKQRYLQDPSKYAAFKKELTGRMLELIDEKIFPGLLSGIESCECYTPWDVFQELGAEAGNAYGRRLTLKNLLAGPPPQLPFENLHIACASVGLPGIATAFQTAAHLFFKLSGRRI
jgi:phytoene dehydrogenase-like protein